MNDVCAVCVLSNESLLCLAHSPAPASTTICVHYSLSPGHLPCFLANVFLLLYFFSLFSFRAFNALSKKDIFKYIRVYMYIKWFANFRSILQISVVNLTLYLDQLKKNLLWLVKPTRIIQNVSAQLLSLLNLFCLARSSALTLSFDWCMYACVRLFFFFYSSFVFFFFFAFHISHYIF